MLGAQFLCRTDSAGWITAEGGKPHSHGDSKENVNLCRNWTVFSLELLLIFFYDCIPLSQLLRWIVCAGVQLDQNMQDISIKEQVKIL